MLQSDQVELKLFAEKKTLIFAPELQSDQVELKYAENKDCERELNRFNRTRWN